MPNEDAPRRGYLLMDMLKYYYWLDDALNRNLHRLGWPDITRAQCLILVQLANGITRAKDMARNLGVSQPAMSQFLKEMRAKGLIEFERDPADRRAIIVCFSLRSEEIRDDAIKIVEIVERELAKRIGTRKLEGLRCALGDDWGAIPLVDRIDGTIRLCGENANGHSQATDKR